MRDLLKRLAKLVAGYGAVQWAGPFLSLIFTPIITRALTPADYGVSDYLLTIVSAMSTLALLALPQAVTTHFNDRPDDPVWRRTVTGSAFFVAGVMGLVAGVLLFLFAPILTANSPILGPYTGLVRLIAVTFVFGLTSSILTTSAQAALRVRWGMIFSLIAILGTVFGNVLFIVVLDLGVTGMILTPTVTGFCIWLAAMILTRGMIGRPSSRTVKLLMGSGLTLLPTMLAAWTLLVSDRLFLARHVTETELGYYAIANKMASLVGVAMAPIYLSWAPLALAVQHQPGASGRYVAISRYLIATVLMAGLGIGIFATEILIVLTRPAYLPAAPYVGFLAYIHVFSGFGAVFTTGAVMGKQLASVTGSVVSGAVANVLLNMVLIPRYGLWGATAATVIGFGVPQVILYLVLQKRYPIPYPIGKFLVALGVEFTLLLAGLLVPVAYFPVRVSVKFLLLALLPISYLWIGLITPFEANQARLFIQHRLRVTLGMGSAS